MEDSQQLRTAKSALAQIRAKDLGKWTDFHDTVVIEALKAYIDDRPASDWYKEALELIAEYPSADPMAEDVMRQMAKAVLKH